MIYIIITYLLAAIGIFFTAKDVIKDLVSRIVLAMIIPIPLGIFTRTITIVAMFVILYGLEALGYTFSRGAYGLYHTVGICWIGVTVIALILSRNLCKEKKPKPELEAIGSKVQDKIAPTEARQWFSADGRRTIFILFALLLDTVAMMMGPSTRGTSHEASLIPLSNYLGLASLLLATFPPFYGREAFSVRFRIALRAFCIWLAYTFILAVFSYLFLGTPLQD